MSPALLIGWLLLALPMADKAPGLDAVEIDAPHRFYVSYGRMAVEGPVAVCRIRFFRDDLERALAAFHRRPGLKIGVSAEVDSLFLAYFRSRFTVRSRGLALPSELLGSGEEADMWWYTVQFEGEQSLREVEITHRMLLEVLPDQRNILKVSFFPSETSETLYFVEGAEKQTVRDRGK